MRSARVPSLPAIGSDLRKAEAPSSSRIPISSLPTWRADAWLPRPRPDPSWASSPAPTLRAKPSARFAPRLVVPVLSPAARRFSSISAKKLLEGLFVSSTSVAMEGERTSPIGSFARRRRLAFARPTLPFTLTPFRFRASLSALPATISGLEA